MANSQQEEIRFNGPINQDVDDTALPRRHVRDAENCSRLTNAENAYGVARTRRGNALTPYSHPPSVSPPIPVGSVKDEESAALIQAWYNDLGNHEITRLYHQRGSSGETIQLIQSNLLNFQPEEFVSMIIDDETLSWTSLDNIPRQLRLNWAERPEGQQRIHQLYLQEDQAGIVTVTFTFVAVMGLNTIQLFNFYTQTNFPDRATVIRDLSAALNSEPLFNATFIAEPCGEFVEITTLNPEEDWEIFIQTGGNPYLSHAQLVNEYTGFTRNVLDKTCNPLECAPITSYGNDPDRDVNQIKNRFFQFTTRVVRQSREYSSLGQFANPIPSDSCSGGGVSNFILIDFTDPRLSDSVEIADIAYIEIWVREKNVSGYGQWEIAKTIPRYDYVLNQTWRFYNDTVGEIPSSNEQEYYQPAIPLKARAFATLPDQQTSRNVLMNTIEGYDSSCIDAKPTVTYEAARRSFATITFEVNIIAPFRSQAHTQLGQPIHNYGSGTYYGGIAEGAIFGIIDSRTYNFCPSGGLPFYIEGLQLVAISQQEFLGGTLANQTFIPGTSIFDTSQSGTSPNPQNETHLQALGQAMLAGAIRHTVAFDVPAAGRYHIRAADPRSHFGAADPTLDLGDIALRYQRRSGPALFNNCNPAAIPEVTANQYEVIVDVPTSGGTFNLGPVHYIDTANGSTIVQVGYAYNDEGKPNLGTSIIDTGEPMEFQQIQLYIDSGATTPIPGTPYIVQQTGLNYLTNLFPSGGVTAGGVQSDIITDHNGYFISAYDPISSINMHAAMVGVTGDPSNPVGSITGYGGGNINVNNLQVLHDILEEYYSGTFTGVLTLFQGGFYLLR